MEKAKRLNGNVKNVYKDFINNVKFVLDKDIVRLIWRKKLKKLMFLKCF